MTPAVHPLLVARPLLPILNVRQLILNDARMFLTAFAKDPRQGP